MIHATNITRKDIGKTVKALVKGNYLMSEIVGYHNRYGKYVAFVIDSCEYKPVDLKYCDNDRAIKSLEGKIVDILKEEPCTVYPVENIADYLWDTDYDDLEYLALEHVLKEMVKDENSNVEYHIPSGGYLYVP